MLLNGSTAIEGRFGTERFRDYLPTSRHFGLREAGALKEVVADLTLENRLLKKSITGAGGDGA